MRLLVTRPRPACERTALRLEALGHEVALLPLMQAQHSPAVQAALTRQHDALAVTSAEAIRGLAALGPALEPHLATPLFAVGEATARAAAGLGFSDLRVGAGTGEALAETVAARMKPGETLLYLAGSPRAEGFERALAGRQIDLVIVDCYRVVPVSYGPGILPGLVRSAPFDAVLIYSRETALRLAALLRRSSIAAPALSARYLCLSASAKDALPAEAAAEVAAAPDEESLLALL